MNSHDGAARPGLTLAALDEARRFVMPPAAESAPGPRHGRGGDAGVEGNTRLTAVNGLVLLVLLAVEGVTILGIEGMISLHIIVGLILVGPIVLKSLTTGYRFVRYYGRSGAYRRKGPPHPVLRILGPLVLISSLAVLGTGIALGLVGPDHREPLLTAHQAVFVVWLVAMTLHVLGHALHAGAVSLREWRDTAATRTGRRRPWRVLALVMSLVLGVALATGLTPAMRSWIDQPAGAHSQEWNQFQDGAPAPRG